MSNFFTSVLLAAALSAWVYSKIYSKTGGDTKRSIVSAGLAFAIGFVMMLTALQVIAP